MAWPDVTPRVELGPAFDGDENQEWREEAFGERPVLGPWGDPFHGPESDEPLECGLENPEVCESCE
jgi:hypothetical protein